MAKYIKISGDYYTREAVELMAKNVSKVVLSYWQIYQFACERGDKCGMTKAIRAYNGHCLNLNRLNNMLDTYIVLHGQSSKWVCETDL